MRSSDTRIAVVGMGCRFPGANSVPEFWELLCNGLDATSEIPASHFDVDAVYDPRPGVPGRMNTRRGGFLSDIDKFDPYFFGLSPREAIGIDPQHRLLLETAWQCVEDAGVTSSQLAKCRTGVFVGLCTDDYQSVGRAAAAYIDVRFAMGIARSNAAGRISYLLGLTGPSLCLDTACSSSLLAIHLAIRSLREGECELAFAGGVNAILEPTTMIAFSQGGLLAADGRCKAFDESADGFGRSEGAGMILLKPLRRAIEDGDRVYAVIRGSATNNDGPASLFMAPSREGQEAVLRAACTDAKVNPLEIQFVESHGTGTPIGDPIEIESLAAVMGCGRAMDAPLHVGALKTNIGHLEGGAGVAGVIKTALILRHGIIPPNLHLKQPNSRVAWDQLPIFLPKHVTPWPEGKPKLAGVSSFGISGTNVHAILEAAPPDAERDRRTDAPQRVHVLLISARDQHSLSESASLWKSHLAASTHSLGDICHMAALRRNHFEYRLSIAASTHAGMAATLSGWASGENSPGLASGRTEGTEWRKPVFVFSGVGSQWPRMGLSLRDSYPIFRAALDRAEELILGFAGWSLLEELSRNEQNTRFGRIDIFQPSSAAIQIGLAELWMSWGIEPGLVIGHSVGEIPAAYIAGALTFDQALRIAIARSEVMHRAANTGSMLACELTPDAAVRILEGLEDRVSVAVINGKNAVVLSGDTAALTNVAADLERRDVFCRWVRMPVPSHSPLMEPLLEDLKRTVGEIKPGTARIPILSTVDNQIHHGQALTPEYWARNLRHTVRFAGAVDLALNQGENVFIEVSPHAMLVEHIRQAASASSRSCLAIPSMRRGDDARLVMLESLGRLHCNGYPVDWRMHDQPGACPVTIPGHPLRPERFWVDLPVSFAQIHQLNRKGSHAMLPNPWAPADKPSTHIWEFTLNSTLFPFLAEHAFESHPILPGAVYCELMLAAAEAVFGTGPRVFRSIQFHRSLFLESDTSVRVQVSLSEAENGKAPIRFYVQSGLESGGTAWDLYAEAILIVDDNAPPALDGPFDADEIRSRLPTVLSETEFYSSTGLIGLEYGPSFRSIRHTWTDKKTESLGQVLMPEFLAAESRRFKIHPAALDTLLQITLTPLVADSSGKLIMPFFIEEFRTGGVFANSEFWIHATHHSAPKGCGLTDIEAIAPDGQVLVSIRGLKSKTVGQAEVTSDTKDWAQWIYDVRWDLSAAPSKDLAPGWWLIFADAVPMGRHLETCLKRYGQHCIIAPPNWTEPDTLTLLLANFGDESQAAPWRGIVYLDALGGPHSNQKEICGGLLTLLQSRESIRRPHSPRLFVITRGAQSIGEADPPVDLSQGPILGFTRSAALEHPELAATLIDLDPAASGADSPDRLAQELLAASGEREIALRGADRYVARLARLDLKQLPPRRKLIHTGDDDVSYRVYTSAPGVLDRIGLQRSSRRSPGRGEVEVRVGAVGLNFLDVLRSLNMYPGQEPGDVAFGMESAGQVVRVGEGVVHFKPGDSVIALPEPNAGCFQAYLTIPARQAFALPNGFSLEQAATIPVTYQTAWYALCHLSRLQKGESVLVHAGAGGVGLAAIQIAKYAGAEIFATAGSAEKREYLRTIGVDHVMDSRTLAFADEVMEITKGRGVDVVLNSIAGEAIQKSLSVLAPKGRFLEIGKRDIYANSSLGLLPFRKNLSFFAVDMLGLSIENPDLIEDLTREILEHVNAGHIGPLPHTAFPASQAAEAFRFMAQAKHIGKVVLTFAEKEVEAEVAMDKIIRPNATYLITGGLTGLGLKCAQWIAEEGGGNLVLAGRRAPDANANEAISKMRASGANVRIATVDVSSASQVQALVANVKEGMPPLAGVIHAAGLLRDAIVDNLTWADFDAVLAPKLDGGWNLQRALGSEDLDFFVLFSSIASMMGSPGQANYSAANGFLDSLAQYRRSHGMPVLCLNWGPWAEIGMAARPDRGGRMAESGMPGIPPQDGIAVLRHLLSKQCVQAAILRADWKSWAQHQPGLTTAPFFSNLHCEMQSQSRETADSSLAAQITGLDREEALALLEDCLREEVRRVLRIPEDRLDRHTSLTRLGLDSLMAVELKNRIDSKSGSSIPVMRLLKGPTLAEMSVILYDILNDGHVKRILSPKPPDVDSLSDSEVETLLQHFAD